MSYNNEFVTPKSQLSTPQSSRPTFEKQTTKGKYVSCSICHTLISPSDSEDQKSIVNSTTEDEDLDFQDNPFIQNPFNNKLILENISKYADYSTLKVARVVCRKWNRAFFSRFEKKTNVLVKFDVEQKSICDFTEIFNSAFNDGRIYHCMQFVNPIHLDYPSMNNWMTKYGKYLNIIKLGSDCPVDTELRKAFKVSLNSKSDLHAVSMESIEHLLLDWCPNLKHLTIPFARAKNVEDLKLTEKVYSQEERVVSLSTFTLGNMDFELWELSPLSLYDVAEQLTNAILNRAKSVQNVTVKCLESNYRRMKILTNSLLTEKNNIYLVESLHSLDFSEFCVDPQAFVTLIKLKLTNLKHLKIRTAFAATMFIVPDISQQNNLETLEMNIVDDENFNFNLIVILKIFAALKMLALNVQPVFIGLEDYKNNYDVEELTINSIKDGFLAAANLTSLHLAGVKVSMEGYNILVQSKSKFELELVNCLITTT